MTAKSVEEIQTSLQTMNEEFGSMPETLGDNSLSQPIQGNDMSVKEYYDQFCIWISKLEAVNSVYYVDDDEWYVVDFFFGLKMDLMERVFRHKGIRRVSEAFRWAAIEENSGKNVADVVFDEMSQHCDEVQEAKEVGNEKSHDLVVQLKADHGKIVPLNADRHMLDELPKPALTASTAYKLIDDDLDVYLELNSQEEETYYQNFGKSENGALMLNKSTSLVFTGLNSFPEKLILAEFVLVRAAYQVFDKMPQLSFVWPFEQLNGNKGFIPLIDFVPRVFDPGSVKGEIWRLIFDLGGRSMGCSKIIKVFDRGDGIETVTPVGWRFGWRFYPVSTRFHMFDKMPKQISLDQTKGKSAKVFMLIFDPGGHLSYHNGCSFFKPIHFNTFDKMLNQLSKNFQLEQEYCDLSNMKIVELNETQEVVFIFDPGGHSVCYMVCSSLRPIGKKNCALCDFWADELTSAAFQLCVPDPCSRVSSLHQTGYASRHSLEPRKINGNAIMTIFDPGGILVYYNGCDPFAEHRQNDMIWSFHSNSRNDGAEIWCFWGSFQHCVGAYLLHLSTVLMINMSMIEFSYNHCCWTIYKIYEHYLEPRQQFVGNFRIGMLAGSCHFPEGRFPGGYKNVVLLMAIILESFVWDPGLRATFFSPVTCSAGVIFVRILLLYILGDKDDFEGKGR